MTSGVRKNPMPVTCEQCGKTSLWKGGRKRRFCSPTCAHANRYKPKSSKRTRFTPQKELSDQLKIDRGNCADCQMIINTETVVVIEWDHRDPTTKNFTISYKLNRIPDAALIAEIAKCDAVCANCHRYRTHYGKHHLVRRNNTSTDSQQPQLFTHD